MTSIMVPAHNLCFRFCETFWFWCRISLFSVQHFFIIIIFSFGLLFCSFFFLVRLFVGLCTACSCCCWLSSIQNEISRKKTCANRSITHTAHTHTLNINQNGRPKTNNKKIARFGHFHWPEAVCNGCKPTRRLPIWSTWFVLVVSVRLRFVQQAPHAGGNSKIGFSTILISGML